MTKPAPCLPLLAGVGIDINVYQLTAFQSSGKAGEFLCLQDTRYCQADLNHVTISSSGVRPQNEFICKNAKIYSLDVSPTPPEDCKPTDQLKPKTNALSSAEHFIKNVNCSKRFIPVILCEERKVFYDKSLTQEKTFSAKPRLLAK